MGETLAVGLVAFVLGFAAGNWTAVRRITRVLVGLLHMQQRGPKGPPS